MRAWVSVTAAAAGIAWVLGLLPSSITNIETYPPLMVASVGLVLGCIFLLLMGGAQWLVRRHYVTRARWWIAVNAVAWPLGVVVSILGISLIPDHAALAIMILVGILSGLAMGMVVGALTGVALAWLLADRSPQQRVVSAQPR